MQSTVELFQEMSQRHLDESVSIFTEALNIKQAQIDDLTWRLQNANGQADEFCKKSLELQKKLAYSENAYKNVKSQFLNAEDDLTALQKRIDNALVYLRHTDSREQNEKVLCRILKGEN